LVLDTLYTN